MAFPAPPGYYTLYSSPETALPPPPPPADDATEMTLYGAKHSLSGRVPSLEESGSRRLGGDESGETHIAELRRLNQSIMFNFLQLSGLLLTRPQSVRAKIDELQLLFINAHHRLNRYRELQAADSIVGYLEQQTERRRKVAEDLRAHLAASKKTVADALSALQEGRSDAEETVATLRQAMASAQGAADVSVSNGAQSRGMDEANAVDEDSSNDDVGQAGLTTVLVADGAEESTFSAPGALPSAVEMPEDSDVGDQATQASRSTAETEEKVFFIRQSATDLQKLLEETK